MKKLNIFSIILVCFLFFIFLLPPRFVSAQDCGDANAEPPGNKCCNVDIDKIDINIPITISSEEAKTKDASKPNRGGCLHIPLPVIGGDLFCLSDILESSKKSVVNILNREGALKALAGLGACKTGEPNKVDVQDAKCICKFKEQAGGINAQFCNTYILGSLKANNVKDLLKSKEYTGCLDCFAKTGYWSALGCIYLNDWKSFMEKNVFGIGIGLAGLIALLCIIYSAIILQTSSGNPEKIKNAQERLTACITGLMLIIFSIFILRLIGVSILGIPGFK